MNNFDEFLYLILKWNVDFPIDRWWRKTHSVAFNSERHRESSFIDMLIEWEEDRLFEKIEREKYIPDIGDYLKKREVKEDEISEEAFNKIDF